MNDYEFKISQFIDNELATDEQPEFFRFLSENEEARRMLADYIEMKENAKAFYSELDTELDSSKAIKSGLTNSNNREKKYNVMFYFSAAAAIVLAFFLFFNISKNNIDSRKYFNLQTKYISLQENYNNILSEKIELIKLSENLSSKIKESKSKQISLSSKPVLKKKNTNAKYKQPARITFHSRRAYAANIPVYRITKDDFLGQQIIGN